MEATINGSLIYFDSFVLFALVLLISTAFQFSIAIPLAFIGSLTTSLFIYFCVGFMNKLDLSFSKFWVHSFLISFVISRNFGAPTLMHFGLGILVSAITVIFQFEFLPVQEKKELCAPIVKGILWGGERYNRREIHERICTFFLFLFLFLFWSIT